MPPVNEWTIHETTDGGDGIHGCHIVQTTTGFDFTHGTKVLASVTEKAPSFTFPEFVHKNRFWSIGASSLPAGNSASGSYSSWPDVDDDPGGTGPEEGEWTAQAGSGVPDEDADEDTDEDGGEDADEMSVSA